MRRPPSLSIVGLISLSLPSAHGLVYEPTDPRSDEPWWNTHYKWVVMLIILAIGLSLLAVLAVYLKRRHERKKDHIKEGFNAGITTRSVPSAGYKNGEDGAVDSSCLSNTQMSGAATLEPGSGHNTPVRTRDAFMPYGYGYTRSESRFGSHTDVNARKSPLATWNTPLKEMEKEVGSGASPKSQGGPDIAHGRSDKKKILVRERNVLGPDDLGFEKQAG